MNVSFATTQSEPLVVGADEVFAALAITLDSASWSLAGGSASLTLADPTRTKTTLAGTISSDSVTVAWTVAAPEGMWYRAWTFIDSTGFEQITEPFAFQVVSSPI